MTRRRRWPLAVRRAPGVEAAAVTATAAVGDDGVVVDDDGVADDDRRDPFPSGVRCSTGVTAR